MSDPSCSLRPELYLTEIEVSRWSIVVRWYVEILGLRLSLQEDASGYALLEAGAGRLALKRRGSPAENPPGQVRLLFQVEDVDTERIRLLAQGVPVSEPVDNVRESYREVRLTDPEGTPLILFERR
ncbi:MAG: hypothetical protein NVSMB9_02210 [Isosphaeraceae bacterium]